MNKSNIDIKNLSGKASKEAEDLLNRSMKYIQETRQHLNRVYLVLCFVIGMRFSAWLLQFVEPGLAGYRSSDCLAIGIVSFVIALTAVWFMDCIISCTVMKRRLYILEDGLNKALRYSPKSKIKRVEFTKGSFILFQGFREIVCRDTKQDILSKMLFFIPKSEFMTAKGEEKR